MCSSCVVSSTASTRAGETDHANQSQVCCSFWIWSRKSDGEKDARSDKLIKCAHTNSDNSPPLWTQMTQPVKRLKVIQDGAQILNVSFESFRKQFSNSRGRRLDMNARIVGAIAAARAFAFHPRSRLICALRGGKKIQYPLLTYTRRSDFVRARSPLAYRSEHMRRANVRTERDNLCWRRLLDVLITFERILGIVCQIHSACGVVPGPRVIIRGI